MKEQQLERIWTKDFISIALTQLLLFTVFYALLTTLPLYVMQELKGSQSSAGLVVTFMLISAILVRPFSAKILEMTGKRKGLISTIILFALTNVVYLFVHDIIPLLVLRFIHGISFAIVTTATSAIVADTIPAARRGAGMGYFAMAMNIAIVIGPFIGLTILQISSFDTLFFVLNIFMVIGVFCAVSVRTVDPVVEKSANAKWLDIKWEDLIEKNAVPVALISGLVGVAYASILSFVSVYAEEIGLDAVASYFFLVFAVVMIASRPYLGRAFDEKGPRVVLIPSLIAFAFGLMLLGLTTTATMLLVSAGFIGLGYGTLLPGFQTMTIEYAAKERSGHAIATFYIFYDIGIATGSYTWGIIAEKVSFGFMYLISAIFVAGISIVFHLYLAKRKKSKQVKKEEAIPIQ